MFVRGRVAPPRKEAGLSRLPPWGALHGRKALRDRSIEAPIALFLLLLVVVLLPLRPQLSLFALADSGEKKNTLISSSLPLFFFGRRSLSLSLSLDAPAPHAPIYHAFAAAPLWSLRLFSLAAAGACRRFPEGSKRPQKVDLLLCFSSSFNLPFTSTLTRQQTRLLLLRRPPPRRAVSSVSAAAMSSSASHHRFGDAEMEAAAAELVPPLAGKSRARDFSFLLLSFLFFFSLSFSVSKK